MGAKQNSFKRKLLATSISSCILATASAGVSAQDEKILEEVQVLGIRASLEAAMDIKRDSSGVVDAISAEDIGKFPDTNLAESLQRITGVSIDRANGEGSQVTVRGFGPSYNMITLNGRVMPGAVNDPDGAPNSRAFDFANLASESIKAVEVYKTSRANLASGGLGASINIATARPLDDPGLNLGVGVKAVHDTTNMSGSDITPEYSGIFSWTNDEETLGVALTGSFQERESTNVSSYVTDWRRNDLYNPAATVVNAPSAGELYYLPSDLRYSIEDQHRERTNAQLTVQYRPIDRLTATVDYTYAENDITRSRAEQSVWFEPGNITALTFSDDVVTSPLLYAEDNTNKDISFAQRDSHTVALNKSFGINLEYEATDSLSFSLDYHNSSAATQPQGGYSLANASIAAFVVDTQSVDWRSDLPTMSITVDDSARGEDSNGVLDAGDMTTTRGTVHYSAQKTDIEQLQLNGAFEADAFAVGFGVESRTGANTSVYGSNDPIMGDWGGANVERVPDEFFTPRNYADAFADDYSSAEGAFSGGMDANFHELIRWTEMQAAIDNAAAVRDPEFSPAYRDYPKGQYTFSGEFNTNRFIEEEVNGAYVQFDTDIDLAGMPTHARVGVRYEQTDVTSISNVQLPTEILWEDNDDMNIVLSEEFTPYREENSYNHVLPNLDLDISPMEDLKVRVSYSKTIGRPLYQELQSDVTIEKGDLIPRSATGGNPNLLPIESDNFDISAEWYYGDTSYVSLGYFMKDVTGFIGQGVITQELYGLRDVRRGPRFQQAMEDLGVDASQTNAIFEQMLINEDKNPADQSTLLTANESDPFVQWDTSVPVNDRDAQIDGIEFAVQHMFGDSGFGTQFNYTMVDADVEFDVTSTGSQFAIVGLSDTANLVAFYDRDGLQARIAYNWRDQFLSSRGEGGNGEEPEFTEAYAQVDANISYELTDSLTVFAEGLNLTEENSRQHARTESMLWNLENLGARYQVGVRWSL